VQFLAPAINLTDFDQRYTQLLTIKTINQMRVFAMKDSLEQADPTCHPYHKSLLYLIHNALRRTQNRLARLADIHPEEPSSFKNSLFYFFQDRFRRGSRQSKQSDHSWRISLRWRNYGQRLTTNTTPYKPTETSANIPSTPTTSLDSRC
jgi:hypothetical protein